MLHNIVNMLSKTTGTLCNKACELHTLPIWDHRQTEEALLLLLSLRFVVPSKET